jgi:hypothetical protein
MLGVLGKGRRLTLGDPTTILSIDFALLPPTLGMTESEISLGASLLAVSAFRILLMMVFD